MQTTLSARDAATIRDRVARTRLNLSDTRGRAATGDGRRPAGHTSKSSTPAKAAPLSPASIHGDADINGDVDLAGDLLERARPTSPRVVHGRESNESRMQRLAAAITAATAELADEQLAGVARLLGDPS